MTMTSVNVSTGSASKRSLNNSIVISGIILAIALLLPLVLDSALIGDFAYFLLWTFCAIGLAAMWGHGGILSFGQTAFFGLAGYTYGVMTLNFGDGVLSTWSGLLFALLLAAAVAAALGYLMFYGGVTGIFIGIVTLSFTLVLETFMSQTAGPQWVIGSARLNGFNGMSGMPPLSLPGADGELFTLEGNAFYYLIVLLLAVIYWGVRRLLRSNFGLTLASIRENPRRAEMLGIDIRRYQLLVFVLGGVLSGLSGALYTIWGSYITPSSMGLTAAAMPVIWVATAGRKNIFGTVVITALMVWLSQWLAVYGSEYAMILLGFILLFVVLAAPNGLLPWLAEKIRRLTVRHQTKRNVQHKGARP
ncbi:amino acid/amide ABC transporter membrane protein 2 (HAAT family)|uniref:Amino acid/amide ABC transporter membrane protein 2 (HAAT family) n=2 Tax=Brenneria salicis TaxID=55214 RepID=A0A366IBX0_9GAMM|nr:branched-chain amino acid ABC transporter permease [Brenneria salicis]NMN92416.1 amino acid/amide ABC transporter membrane protein 2 (HAAT family) [Brenneria salicis ATCC 15712 = DSM 30166]RBP67760.1 amino acid/amide ABC transporter membrane protein 2 (HAAT family) [Brenneria salicis ATCC 15712 = DSM 30166]RLM32276.1 ABC transporter permease [Brenneria salicis ATCC 15712 = DSM 30166]